MEPTESHALTRPHL